MTQEKSSLKEWFKIKNPNIQGTIVEYSTDFDFFIQNQMTIVKAGIVYIFFSRLEKKKFKQLTGIGSKGELSETELMNNARIIHSEILAGKHGEGELVK